MIYTVLSISINPALQPNRQFQGSRVPGFRSGCHGRQKSAPSPDPEIFPPNSHCCCIPGFGSAQAPRHIIKTNIDSIWTQSLQSLNDRFFLWKTSRLKCGENVRWRKQAHKEGSLRNSSPSKVQSQALRLKL